MTTWLHSERLAAVLEAVHENDPRNVLDLGCGDGDLLVRLANLPPIERVVGIDICADSLDRLRRRLPSAGQTCNIELICASMLDPPPGLKGFDCAVLLETIEHVDPDRLSQLERAVFHQLQPHRVLVTTPNADFNPLLGVPDRRFRHPDHRFEWGRARFTAWARRVAAQWGHDVGFRDIGGNHPTLGGASQMAIFRKGV